MSGTYIVKCVYCGKPRQFDNSDNVADVCEDCRNALSRKAEHDERQKRAKSIYTGKWEDD